MPIKMGGYSCEGRRDRRVGNRGVRPKLNHHAAGSRWFLEISKFWVATLKEDAKAAENTRRRGTEPSVGKIAQLGQPFRCALGILTF
jgi:hypothetical protein